MNNKEYKNKNHLKLKTIIKKYINQIIQVSSFYIQLYLRLPNHKYILKYNSLHNQHNKLYNNHFFYNHNNHSMLNMLNLHLETLYSNIRNILNKNLTLVVCNHKIFLYKLLIDAIFN